MQFLVFIYIKHDGRNLCEGNLMSGNNNNYNTALGIGAGGATYLCVSKYGAKPVIKGIMSKWADYTPGEKSVLEGALTRSYNKSGLAAKGVEIVDINPANKDVAFDKFVKKIDKLLTDFIKVYIKPKDNKKINIVGKDTNVYKNLKKFANGVAAGKNAFYHTISKQLLINKKEFSFAGFHELGHAINANMNPWTNALHWGRHGFAFLAPVALVVGLLKEKKPEGEKPKNFMDKVETFTKDNCGKVVFMAMVPTLAEEGLASINGHKLAKSVLKPDLLKKLAKTNALAWGTYFASAVAMGVGANLAVKVKDRIAQNKN